MIRTYSGKVGSERIKTFFPDDRFAINFFSIHIEINKKRIMNKNNYTPNPIDTKNVALPKGLEALAENIAKNVHEVWSAGRMKDGWTYGEERNDTEKKHPCLMPYEELPEEEKEYDRNTSIETIKLILKLGFKITRDSQYMR